MYILSLNYVKPVCEIDQFIDEHINYLKKYYKAGVFVMSGRKVPRTGGVILAKGVSPEELDIIIHEDPFQKNGIAKYTVTQFIPTMTMDEISILKETLSD